MEYISYGRRVLGQGLSRHGVIAQGADNSIQKAEKGSAGRTTLVTPWLSMANCSLVLYRDCSIIYDGMINGFHMAISGQKSLVKYVGEVCTWYMYHVAHCLAFYLFLGNLILYPMAYSDISQ